MTTITLTRVNGKGEKGKMPPKSVLIRNVMDIITDRGYDFDECDDRCDEALSFELVEFLKEYHLSDDPETVIKRFMEN